MRETKLTVAQKQKFADWMGSKAPLIGKCSLCGDRRWTVLDHLIEFRPYAGGNMILGGMTYPHVGIICENCGHSEFVNAVVCGLVPADKPATNPPPSEKPDGK